MKQAQTKQVFIYLGALFIIATLLFIGFRSVTDVTQKSCDAAQQQFKTTLFDTLDTNRGPGNLQEASIPAPCDYTRLCAGTQKSSELSQVMNDTLDAGTGENIFIESNGDFATSLQYDDLASGPAQCVQASQGQFRLTIRGQPRGQVTIS